MSWGNQLYPTFYDRNPRERGDQLSFLLVTPLQWQQLFCVTSFLTFALKLRFNGKESWFDQLGCSTQLDYNDCSRCRHPPPLPVHRGGHGDEHSVGAGAAGLGPGRAAGPLGRAAQGPLRHLRPLHGHVRTLQLLHLHTGVPILSWGRRYSW